MNNEKNPKFSIEGFFGIGKKEKRTPIPLLEKRAIYDKPDSFAQFFRALRYEKEYNVWVMDDEISVGVAFELERYAAEDRSEEDINEFHQKIQYALSSIKERDKNPYIVGTYTEEESLLDIFKETMSYASNNGLREDNIFNDFKKTMGEHFEDISSDEGMFEDNGYCWRASKLTTRILIYRNFCNKTEANLEKNAKEISDLSARVNSTLLSSGVKIKSIDSNGLYQWLNPWFSDLETSKEKQQHVLDNPYIEDTCIEGLPDFESDILDWILGSTPPTNGTNDPSDGVWKWGSSYVRYLPIIGMRNRPKIGHIVSNCGSNNSKRKSAISENPLLYRLPRGSVYVLIYVCKPQDNQIRKMEVIAKSARANSNAASIAREKIKPTLDGMERGHLLYPAYHGFYIKGSTRNNCLDNVKSAIGTLDSEGFKCVEIDSDLHALDETVRSLPFSYDPSMDKYLMRQYPMWLHDIVSLLPVWGYSQVDGHKAILYYDRLGTPISFDPLTDKKRVAHLMMLGSSGSGKSANLNYILWSLNTIHRPRNFIVDYGGSYYLLAEYLKELGFKVKYSTCSPKNPAKFMLFGSALKLLMDAGKASDFKNKKESDDDDDDDPLTHATFVVKLMISGGEPVLFENISKAHSAIIKQAIVLAAKSRAENSEHQQLIPGDLIIAFKLMAKAEKLISRKESLLSMADSISNYTQGFYGDMFNSYVEPSEPYDIEVLDIAKLGTNTEYNDAFLLAWEGLLNKLEIESAIAKKNGDERDTLLCNDEAHITMEVPLMPSVLARKAKVFRKQAIWLILATQDMEDIPPQARKIIGMMEWFIFMSMSKKELAQIEDFIQLDEEQKDLILSTVTEPGKFTEGVLISESFDPQIFRNVPPPIAMALGQTEKSERKNRNLLKEKHNLSGENEVTRLVAQELRANRRL